MSKSYAPYNFIPFSSNPTGDQRNSGSRRLRVPIAYSDRSLLPRHDRLEEGLLSGYISYELINHTPLTIGGKENDFFRDGQGRLVIPGSTMRGHVRSHVEMLSFSYPEMIEDQRYMFRDVAGDKRQIYQDLLENVQAGWLYKQEGNYYIKPVLSCKLPIPGENGTEPGTFKQIHEADLRKMLTSENGSTDFNYFMYSRQIIKFNEKNYTERTLNDKIKKYRREKLNNRNGEYEPYRTGVMRCFWDDDNSEWKIQNTDAQTAENGIDIVLLNSGMMDGKTHHYMVSAKWSDVCLPVDDELVKRYDADRKHSEIQNKNLKKAFYLLPENEGEANGQVFFYTTDEDDQIISIGPTALHRVSYKHSVIQGVPYKKNTTGYDYAQAMFGFIDKSEGSYKSRVSFQNAVFQGNESTEKRKMTLLSPRGTAVKMYLKQESDRLKTFQDSRFELRGYKIYWKRENGYGERVITNPEETESVRVMLQPNIDRRFKGTIFFENLREDELGLLLLALRYEDDLQTHESFMLGGGKPYGYGKVFVNNVQLYLKDHKAALTCLNPAWSCETTQIPNYKEIFKRKMESHFGNRKSYEDMETVQVLRKYLRLEDMSNTKILSEVRNNDGNELSERDIYMNFNLYKNRESLLTAEELIGDTYDGKDMAAAFERLGWIKKKK